MQLEAEKYDLNEKLKRQKYEVSDNFLYFKAAFDTLQCFCQTQLLSNWQFNKIQFTLNSWSLVWGN